MINKRELDLQFDNISVCSNYLIISDNWGKQYLVLEVCGCKKCQVNHCTPIECCCADENNKCTCDIDGGVF